MAAAEGDMTIGGFLHLKLGNFARWATEQVGKENLSFDFNAYVAACSEIEVVVLAELLATHSIQITHRDWQGLQSALHTEGQSLGNNGLAQIVEVLQAIRVREAMHSRFWLYMELFRDVRVDNSRCCYSIVSTP